MWFAKINIHTMYILRMGDDTDEEANIIINGFAN